jgi:hypothetical protein
MKLRKILFSIIALIAGVILISLIRHYQLRAATNAYLAKLKAQGEPMDLDQVLPPSVPTNENGSEIFLKVAAVFPTNQTLLSSNYFYGGMMMVAPGKAMIRATRPDLRDSTSTNSWEEVRASVAQNAELFTSLHQLIDKPNFDFGVGYQKGVVDLNFTNLHLATLKAIAMRLGIASLDRLHRGDAAGAVTDVRTMLAIAQGTERERLVISELVRIAITAITVNDIWEILQSTKVTEQQLAALQKDFASLEFLRAEENALEMERVTGAITLTEFRSSNSTLLHYLLMVENIPWVSSEKKTTAMDLIRLRSRVVRWQYWWSYPDELRTLRGYQALLNAARSASTNYALSSAQSELESNIAKLSIPDANEFVGLSDPMKTDMHFLLSSSIRSLEKTFSRVSKMEAAKQLTVAAIALKRYHLKHAAYPESLTALVPEFLSEVARDPMDGQILRYRLNADGTFLLYSIGDDDKDDGGNPNPPAGSKSIQWQRGHDWVWPQPATDEEIKKFYDNQPK